ncbi:MAG TPA: LysR family transcriptional regulator [Negativicutes bacterium]|jgi:DNA-binding transcriptional LysR family regulator
MVLSYLDGNGGNLMHIRYLHSFFAVADYLNFTKAAKHLCIAQPVLSRQIAILEEQLGVKLFIRNNRSVHLTAAGITLFREAGTLLTNVENIIEKTRQSYTGTSGVSGQLKIGCLGIESDFLPQIIGKFHASYPHIKLNIQQVTGEMLNTGLKTGDLDIAFNGYMGNEPPTSPFMHREVRRSRICFLLPYNHPYAHLPSIDFTTLSQERFIVLSEVDCPQGSAWFFKQCKKAGFTPNIVTLTPRMDTVFLEVEAGLGISFTIRDPLISHTFNSRISLVNMEGDDAFGSLIVTWEKENSNPAVSLFIKEFDDIPCILGD